MKKAHVMRDHAGVQLSFAFLILAAVAVPALAQSPRSFVASTGLDTNPCSRSSPCRNFAAAVAATAIGGEVVVLDSAGYGPVTITQSVTLVAPSGVYAGVASTFAPAITINAPGSKVALRGLSVNGIGTSVGIAVQASSLMYIESCTVSRFGSGVAFSSNGLLFVEDSAFREHTNALTINPANGIVTGFVDHCSFENNADNGLLVQGTAAPGTTVVVRDSLASGGQSGINVVGAEVNIKNCVSTDSNTGFNATTGGTVAITGSTSADNTTGFAESGGATFKSFGDNVVDNNTTPSTGTITPVAKQ